MTATKRETRVVFRIMSKAPGEERWKYRRFTYSRSGDMDMIRKGLAFARRGHPGWKYKVQFQTLVIETTETPWADTEHWKLFTQVMECGHHRHHVKVSDVIPVGHSVVCGECGNNRGSKVLRREEEPLDSLEDA